MSNIGLNKTQWEYWNYAFNIPEGMGELFKRLEALEADVHTPQKQKEVKKCFHCSGGADHYLSDGDWCCSDCLPLLCD